MTKVDNSNKHENIKIKVKFFANLKEITKKREIEIKLEEKTNISQLLEILFKLYDLRGEILDENNEIKQYINILKNGRQIKFLDGVMTKLEDSDVVAIFPPVAGG